MNLALKMFIEEKGKELLEKNLYRNFVLHVCNLFEFGVLGPGHVFRHVTGMQKFVRERGHYFKAWPDQRSHWQKYPGKFITEQQQNRKVITSPTMSNRKDFSGIFKTTRDNNINPFVVLSPLAIQHGVIDSDDNSKEDLEEDKKEQVEQSVAPVKQEES